VLQVPILMAPRSFKSVLAVVKVTTQTLLVRRVVMLALSAPTVGLMVVPTV